MSADYECLGCGHRWTGRPGPTDCPRCDHRYVKWLDYETQFVRGVDFSRARAHR